MSWLPLTKPVQAHGETLHGLELRDPTGKDVREIGYPYQLNTDGSVKLLAGVVAQYLTRLASVPPSAVDQLSPGDLNSAGWLVAGFFLQGETADSSSIDISTAQDTGV